MCTATSHRMAGAHPLAVPGSHRASKCGEWRVLTPRHGCAAYVRLMGSRGCFLTERQEAPPAGTCFLPASSGRGGSPQWGDHRGSRSPPCSSCPTWVASHLSEKVAATREAGSCGDSGSGSSSNSSGGGRQWRSEGQTH